MIESKTKTDFYFKWEVKMMVGNEYTVIGDYNGARDKIKMKHNKCGYVWDVLATNFITSKSRCPKCGLESSSLAKRYTQEDFESLVFDEVGEEYTVMGDYVNSQTKIAMRHNSCGNIWSVKPGIFLNSKTRCPKCRYSRGEKFINYCLTEWGFKFKTQFSFKDLRGIGGNPLLFDFAIVSSNGNLVCLIEFDGEHHYQINDSWGGEDNLRKVQYHDSLKNEYCVKNEISLIRIPYWERDIVGEVLKRDLIELELLSKDGDRILV